jgi:hypothetical protein
MEKPEALFLADELEAPLGTVVGAELYRRAAKELRRLHAELERCKQVCAATAEGWRVERDALLEALKKAEENGCATVYSNEDDECGEKGCCGVVSYKPHAADCWVTTARAAIKAVEETK